MKVIPQGLVVQTKAGVGVRTMALNGSIVTTQCVAHRLPLDSHGAARHPIPHDRSVDTGKCFQLLPVLSSEI